MIILKLKKWKFGFRRDPDDRVLFVGPWRVCFDIVDSWDKTKASSQAAHMMPFIAINDRHVKISCRWGSLFFTNSSPSPSFRVEYGTVVRWWGGWGFMPYPPEPGIDYSIVRPEVIFEP
jgi:hypothetical protein